MKKAVMKTDVNKLAFPMFPRGAATNPKPEIRSPKETRGPKFKIGAGRSGLGSGFDFRNSFGIRHSAFGFFQVPAGRLNPLRHRRLESSRCAFTLIELLVVIAIMATLAALILPVAGMVKKHQYLYNTQTQMAQLETAIDRYKAAYGFYPPSPTNPPTVGNQSSYINQLYYELVGTTNYNNNNNNVYQTLDGSTQIQASDVPSAFSGVGGFVNCSKPGAGEDAPAARNFLPDLKPNQVWINYTNNKVGVTLLIGPVGGPDAQYQPLGLQDVNPWRYNSSNPTNNPGSYDLWMQLVIGKQTNLICNWTKQVQVNAPLP
jgi:prepilin-type N-terminal cleavage/methylation domain-containing protein